MSSLSPTQKMQVKRALGYHSVSQSRYPLVEGFYAVDSILSDLPDETVGEVTQILTRLSNLEGGLDDAADRLKVARLGNIVLNNDEQPMLWREIRRWRRELAVLVGIPMRSRGGQIVVT